MTQKTYRLLEDYMLQCTGDSAHDSGHIYRVLYSALEIARTEENVDTDLLITACLLHDIGRPEQFADPTLCHAEVGSEKARRFLTAQGFSPEFAHRAARCILTHRFRKSRPPESIEAKILFDADKLDVTGAVGIARTLLYRAAVDQPLYALGPDGSVSDGTLEGEATFFREYKFKLEKLYDRFYTETGARLAARRRGAAEDFARSLYREVSHAYTSGPRLLDELITEE